MCTTNIKRFHRPKSGIGYKIAVKKPNGFARAFSNGFMLKTFDTYRYPEIELAKAPKPDSDSYNNKHPDAKNWHIYNDLEDVIGAYYYWHDDKDDLRIVKVEYKKAYKYGHELSSFTSGITKVILAKKMRIIEDITEAALYG